MPILCRTATEQDLDDINALYQSDWHAISKFSKRQELIFKRLVSERLTELLVVEKDKFVVACCHYMTMPTLAHGGRSMAMLGHFAVDPINRQQGHAKRLLSFAIDFARKQGCYQVLIQVDKLQHWQKQLLQSYGFCENTGSLVLQ
ncbi:GNAT family N-acetyltransferase [Reinekea marinisedimentorum]|nr:GNAT family N-acetyltransferase [Reinekea marinisedimentorum]